MSAVEKGAELRTLESIWLVRKFDEKMKYDVTSSFEFFYLLNVNYVTVSEHTGKQITLRLTP